MSLTIRTADHGDLPGVLALYRYLHPNDPPPEATVAEAAWLALLSSGIVRVIVADGEGQIASSCTLTMVPNLTRGCRPYGVIENVVTRPEYRRRGLGGGVLAYAVEAAREAGCYKVSLATGSKQEATLRFYENAGFEKGRKSFFEVRWP